MARTKSSLFPGMNSMAICAQEFQVPLICVPIFKPGSPRIAVPGWSDFGRWINMVYIKCAFIRESTLNTFASKGINQATFLFPISVVFPVAAIRFSVPIIFLATGRAERIVAILPTFSALAIITPASLQIAFLVTVFARAFLDTIGVHLVLFAAIFTNDCNFWILHA